MSGSFKPEGYNSVSAYLVVDGAERTIEFLKEVFGAQELYRTNEHGRIKHAEVLIDDTVVMIADRGMGWKPIEALVHIYVKDVDETYERAIKAGAVSVQKPTQNDDPDKRGAVRDAGGTTWWISTRVGERQPK